MLYIVGSDKGVSKPYFSKSSLAVNQQVYMEFSLQPILLLFIEKYHKRDNQVFWPDKASINYAKCVLQFLKDENIPFVPKSKNPTNLPQCRPIKDFFVQLAQMVCQGHFKAENVKLFQNRIRNCLRKIDVTAVQRACRHIRQNLRAVYENGPFVRNYYFFLFRNIKHY